MSSKVPFEPPGDLGVVHGLANSATKSGDAATVGYWTRCGRRLRASAFNDRQVSQWSSDVTCPDCQYKPPPPPAHECVVLARGDELFPKITAVDGTLDRLHRERPITLLVSNGRPGAGTIAHTWAIQRGVPREQITDPAVLESLSIDVVVTWTGDEIDVEQRSTNPYDPEPQTPLTDVPDLVTLAPIEQPDEFTGALF